MEAESSVMTGIWGVPPTGLDYLGQVRGEYVQYCTADGDRGTVGGGVRENGTSVHFPISLPSANFSGFGEWREWRQDSAAGLSPSGDWCPRVAERGCGKG